MMRSVSMSLPCRGMARPSKRLRLTSSIVLVLSLIAWGAGELCSTRTIAGRFGNPPRVSISVDPEDFARVSDLAGDGRGGDHERAHEQGAPLPRALPSLEI